MGAALTLETGALAEGTFLPSVVALDSGIGFVVTGFEGLDRLIGAAGPVLVPGELGVVALLLPEFTGAVFGRLKSADLAVVVIFLASTGFASALMVVGLLGMVFLGAWPVVEATATAGTIAALGVPVAGFTAARGVTPANGFETGVLFSGLLIGLLRSRPFGFISLGVKVADRGVVESLGVKLEGRAELDPGRLGVEEATGAGLLVVLPGGGVDCLGLVVEAGLPLAAAGLAEAATAEGFDFFSGLGGSSLLGGAVILPAMASAADDASKFTFSGFCRLVLRSLV